MFNCLIIPLTEHVWKHLHLMYYASQAGVSSTVYYMRFSAEYSYELFLRQLQSLCWNTGIMVTL